MGKKVVFKKELIDPATGEYITAIAFIPEPRDRDFAKVYKLFGEKLLEDLAKGELKGGELKILAWFLAETTKLPVQSDMWIPVSYEELANSINLDITTIKKYIKQLVQKGYLEQFKPRQTVFRLKPNYVYKGYLVKLKEVEPDF